MAIDFPSSPTPGMTYTYPTTGVQYTYVASGTSGYWTVLTANVVGKASAAEVTAMTDNVKYVTPQSLTGFPDASTTVEGKTRFADVAETIAGTATDIAVTPAGLSAAVPGFSSTILLSHGSYSSGTRILSGSITNFDAVQIIHSYTTSAPILHGSQTILVQSILDIGYPAVFAEVDDRAAYWSEVSFVSANSVTITATGDNRIVAIYGINY